MTDELVDAMKASESLSAEKEGLLSLPAILQENSISDYSAAVIAQQIERLRNLASDVDRQYAVNVRGRKIKFKDRVGYLSVREKVATRIVALVEDLLRLQSTDSPTDPIESEQGVNMSWDPDGH